MDTFKFSDWNNEEFIENDLRLRKIALGEEEGELTGYPSKDKPWLKYYSEKHIEAELPHMTAYEYVKERNKDNLDGLAIDSLMGNFTYRELFENIEKTARALYAFGTKKGKIVLAMLPVCPYESFLLYGVDRAGGAYSQLFEMMQPEQIIDAINKYNSDIFFILDAFLSYETEMAIYEKTNLKHIVSISLEPLKNRYERTISWNEFIEQGKNVVIPEITRTPEDLFFLASTGGSTGEPKSVMLSDNCFNIVVHQLINSQLNRSKNDRSMRIWSLFTASCAVSNHHYTLCSMNTDVLREFPLNNNDVEKMIIQEKANHLILLPQYIDILEHSDLLKKSDLHFIKSVGCGGVGITREFDERIEEFLKKSNLDINMGYGWGCTENSSNASMRSCEGNSIIGSVGSPAVKTIVSVFEPNSTKELRFGESGELCICSPTIMLGYYNDEKATSKIIKKHLDGKYWLHTGDLGIIDENGIVTIKGRMSRTIFVFPGPKIYPQKVENLIAEVADVRQVAVCQMPDKEHDTFSIPVCFIVCKEGVNEDQVIESVKAHCEKNLPEYSRPAHIFNLDSLPLTVGGKPDVLILEKWLADNVKV